MSSTFFGFNISKSGLFASQRSLNVVSHNIANANTEGYSRQRVEITQTSPLSLPNGEGMIGTGVTSGKIRQIRDEFLDFKIRQENESLGEWEARYETLSQIEAILNEPSDSGIRQVMDEFFTSLQELSKNPDNLTARAEVRQRGISLTNTLNHMYNQFRDLQENIDFAVETTVDQVNGYAEQIANLNEQIFSSELDGNKANDLRDQRNLLIDKLSELVDIDVYETTGENNSNPGKLKIMVNGTDLVSHSNYKQLEATNRDTKKNYVDADHLLEVKWESGDPFISKSGKLKGLLDVRDNISGNEKGIPYYMDRLNRFTTVFAANFNLQHRQGYGLSGAGNNIDFFNSPSTIDPITGGDPYPSISSYEEKISLYEEKNPGKTAFLSDGTWYETDIVESDQIFISNDIESHLNNIAAALNDDGSGSGLSGDGSNAEELIELRHDVEMFSWGSPEDFFKSLVSNLGVDGQSAKRMQNNQEVLVNQIENQRQSISGVSLDEEMTQMVKFQHSYNANARMITTMDEMIDKLINGTGRVGL